MLIAFAVLFTLALFLFIIALRRKDGSHIRGLKAGKGILLNVIPLLLLAFLVSGLIQVAIPTEIIESWLGDDAGWRGILLGCLAGVLIPGGPYVAFPIIAAIYHAGAGIGTVVSIITGWALLGVVQIPFELAMVGARFMIVRISLSLILPPLAGTLAQIIFGKGF